MTRNAVPFLSSPVRRDAIRRLHASGPRPVGELLAEIAARDPSMAEFIADRLRVYADIAAETYRLTGADDRKPTQ